MRDDPGRVPIRTFSLSVPRGRKRSKPDIECREEQLWGTAIANFADPKRKRPRTFLNVAFIYAGNDLLSHTLSRAVQSALRGLTSVFGMGTGGSPAVRSPTIRSRQSSIFSGQDKPTAPHDSDKLAKDPEDETSQLNRLGRAYFHLCLFPISAPLHRLFVGAQPSVLCLSLAQVLTRY